MHISIFISIFISISISIYIYIYIYICMCMFITSVFVYVYMDFMFECIYLGIGFTNQHVWEFIYCFDCIVSHVHIEKEKKSSKKDFFGKSKYTFD